MYFHIISYGIANGRNGFYCGGSLIHANYVLTGLLWNRFMASFSTIFRITNDIFFHFIAAHCISSPQIVRNRYVIDSVRLGENDLRSDPDCQEVKETRNLIKWLIKKTIKCFVSSFCFDCHDNYSQDECADPVIDIPVAELIVHEYYNPSSTSQENNIALIRLQRAVPYTSYTRPICLPIRDLQNRNYDGLAFVIAGFGRTENGMDKFSIFYTLAIHLELSGFC